MSPTFGFLTRKNHTNIKVGRTSHTISTTPKVMNSTLRISLWRRLLLVDSLYLISPWKISTTNQSVLYIQMLSTRDQALIFKGYITVMINNYHVLISFPPVQMYDLHIIFIYCWMYMYHVSCTLCKCKSYLTAIVYSKHSLMHKNM